MNRSTFNLFEFAIVMTAQDTVAWLGVLTESRKKEIVSRNFLFSTSV